MDDQHLAAQLRREGSTRTYVWEDRPNAHYPDHTHPTETAAHIMLSSLSPSQLSALENGIARFEGLYAPGGYSVTTTAVIGAPRL